VTKRSGSNLGSTADGTDPGVANARPSVEPLTVRPRTAATVIGVGHSKLWELIRDGELKVSRIGRVTLVHVDSIRELIARTTAN
jgi:hypothetical protein